MLKKPMAGMGDSNLRFDGHGWAGALEQVGLYAGDIINIPGGSSRQALHIVKSGMAHKVPVGPILVNFGINDMIQGIGPIEFCRNHLRIKKEFEARFGKRDWVWMPSHYTGHWKLELLRYTLRITAWWHGVRFADLRKYKETMRYIYASPDDPWHLSRPGYDFLAYKVVSETEAP